MTLEHSAVVRAPLHYGDKVKIHDGSRLDGLEGVVFRIKDGEVQVLLDQEVFWFVAEQKLETLK
ncbi:MAG: hypothetical protein NDI73_02850 [Desulfuromonadales bacterium]|nr:hypothetical protein [Desulfuromonadales bacterium]